MTTDNRTNEPTEAQVKLAYLAHLKAPRTRGMDVYGPMRAALVAAARAPVQGEPNDDREEILRKALEHVREVGESGLAGPYVHDLPKDVDSNWGWLQTMWPVVVAVDIALASRTTVPDAATETCGARAVGGWCVLPRAHNMGQLDIPENHRSAEAECDAALAAIERVRAIHVRDEYGLCVECSWEYPETSYDALSNDVSWPCPTVTALDGAPEPEWEYVGVAFEHGGFMRVRNDQLVPEKFESWRKLVAQYPRVEILKRVKAVPAGPWLPVEGESK